MTVEFDKSFSKSIDKIKNAELAEKVERVIIECEKAISVSEIKQSKKLSGYKTYYRIRIGDYRLGFELINPQKIRLIVVANRKDIYKSFP